MKHIPLPLFYFLSWTWGLPMTLCGAIVFFVLRIRKIPVKRFGPCLYAEIGYHWGGLELGMFFLKDSDSGTHICAHEAGHAVQNILFGPLMPLLVSIPSAARYWYREWRYRRKLSLRGRYEAIWFEAQATSFGYRFFSAHLPQVNPTHPSKTS